MKTVKEVAEELGCPKITIYKWLEKQKVNTFGVQKVMTDELIKQFKNRERK